MRLITLDLHTPVGCNVRVFVSALTQSFCQAIWEGMGSSFATLSDSRERHHATPLLWRYAVPILTLDACHVMSHRDSGKLMIATYSGDFNNPPIPSTFAQVAGRLGWRRLSDYLHCLAEHGIEHDRTKRTRAALFNEFFDGYVFEVQNSTRKWKGDRLTLDSQLLSCLMEDGLSPAIDYCQENGVEFKTLPESAESLLRHLLVSQKVTDCLIP